MGIFNKSKSFEDSASTSAPTVNLSSDDIVEPIAPQEVDELVQIRGYIDEFNADLKDSANQQQNVLKRISALTGMIAKIELDVKHQRRLELDNKNLSRNLLELESKLAQKASWASELDSKLNDLDRRHSETREQLELARSNLAASNDAQATQDTKVVEQERLIRSLTVRSTSSEDRFKHAEENVEKLRDSLESQSTELASRTRENVELKSGLEELSAKYERKSKQSDATLVELKNLRLDFNEMKAKHVELTGKLENTKYDLRTQKGVFEDTIKRREEENLALKTRIDQLETQVRIKENMAGHLDQEFITLRNELANERDRCTTLEQRVRQKNEELDHKNSALHTSKKEFEELNEKFAATLEDFETMRRINQLQREKLERYASIGGVSSGQVMLNMDVRPVEEDATLVIPEDSENVTVLKPGNKPRKKS